MLIFAIICAVLLLLLASPVTLRFRYDGTPRMRVWYLCFFYNIPLNKKQKARKRKRQSPKKQRQKKAAKKEKKTDPFRALVEKQGLVGAISDICGTVRLLLERAARLFSHVRAPKLLLSVSTGGTDAAQAAIACGGICAAVYPLLGFASSLVHMCSPRIDIAPDYDSTGWSVRADLTLRVSLWRFLVAGGSAAWALIQSKVKQSQINQTRATPLREKNKRTKKGGV